MPLKGAIAQMYGEEEMRVIDIEINSSLEDAESVWGIRTEVGTKN